MIDSKKQLLILQVFGIEFPFLGANSGLKEM
jgi:hypothetical protein